MREKSSPTFTDLLLAFRQVKKAIATERGAVGLFDLARFEMKLAARISRLELLLADERWFDGLDIGRLLVMPKSAEPLSTNKADIVRIGDASPPKTKLSVRLQLEPTPEFAIVEALYLWEFGGALEATLDDSCLGYRLKRVREDGAMDRHDRDIYDYWPAAFARYRDDPIKTARKALRNNKHVVVTSTDVVSFFDSIDPAFLLEDKFVKSLVEAAERLGRPFSSSRFATATRSLLTKFANFRKLRRSIKTTDIDINIGIPIGALTSRVFANIALSSVDAHIQALPNVILYRRYVDDIVVVSTREPTAPPPATRAEVLGSIFPGFMAGSPTDRFVVPTTGAIFELKEEKTRVHDLVGNAGIDFLVAVQQSFAAVTSERRAFLGDVERLASDIDSVDLFSDGVTGTDRLPRLRDADRFTLRRFIATAFIKGLERCALLLDSREASIFLETKTQRILSILDGSIQFEDFELVLSLLKVALLCKSESIARRLQTWLEHRAGNELSQHVREVSWRGNKLPRALALRAIKAYLKRRLKEGIASACALLEATALPSLTKGTLQNAALLRRTDLRHLDREDDIVLFGSLAPEQPAAARREHAKAREAIRPDNSVNVRLNHIHSFIVRSNRLGERIWSNVSDVSLLLSVKPPRYVDVARRFLARAETVQLVPEIGAQIDECVDALRGTRYRHRSSRAIAVATTSRDSVLRVDATSDPAFVRVILCNIPVAISDFEAAATGRPLLTVERLKSLDHALRDARQAAYEAKLKHLPAIVILPELSVPLRWTRAVAEYAVREELSIIAGVEYETTSRGLVNQAMGVFPGGKRTAAIVRWTKRHPARHEADELRKHNKSLMKPSKSMRRLVVESAHGRLGVLICSELLEAAALSDLSGRVELLFVPAWNDDTASFEYIIHAAASLLVHAFVCVANNAADASDSRIAAPIKKPRHEREWCRLIHRSEVRIIWGDLPVGELRRVHEQKPLQGERVYRPLPPGWGE